MIHWLKSRFNPVPEYYDCLLLLSNGDVCLGRPQPGMDIVGWSVLNRPNWLQAKPLKRGKVAGEEHPRARLSDADCELIRALCLDNGLSYTVVAAKFECSKTTVRDIVKYRRRAPF